MKNLFKTFAVIAVVAAASSSSFASVLTYRISIDGNSATMQPALSVGTHTLLVEAMVTENQIAGNNAGLFQSSFNLGTNNNGFTFTDVTGGFLNTPNATWDSAQFIPPFDGRFQGGTTNGGGPTVSEETHFINPSNYNDKFAAVGANVFSTVAQGTFTYSGGAHPMTLSLTSSPAITLVAGFDGVSQVISQQPTTVVNSTITFTTGDPNTPTNTAPSITNEPVGEQATGLNRTFMYQFLATDTETPSGPFTWSIDSFAGGPAPNAPSIDTTGKFSWNTTGAQGGGTNYTAVVRVTDGGGLFDTATMVINVPEPGSLVLAGLSVIGIVTSRRRKS